MKHLFLTSILLGANRLCAAYDFEAGMTAQEANDGKVSNEAVVKAKENMAKKQIEEDAREVERRLKISSTEQANAEKAGRYASKKKNILKSFSEGLAKAKDAFEASGDWKAYDKELNALKDNKEKSILECKKEIYGEEHRWIAD